MKKFAFAIAGAASIALAGCGGSGDDSLAENVQENMEGPAIRSLLHSSILFRPHQHQRKMRWMRSKLSVRCWWWRRRGTAPRVRNAYST